MEIVWTYTDIPSLALVQRASRCVVAWLLDCVHPEDFQQSIAQYLTQVLAFPCASSDAFQSILNHVYGPSCPLEIWESSSAQILIEDAVVEHIFDHLRTQANASAASACVEGSWVREFACFAISQGVVCPHRLLRRVLAESALITGDEFKLKSGGELETSGSQTDSGNRQRKYASLVYKARLAALIADIPYRKSIKESSSFGNLAAFAGERRRFLAQTYKDLVKRMNRMSSEVSRGRKRRKLSGFIDRNGTKFRASAALDNIITQCAAVYGTVSGVLWQHGEDEQDSNSNWAPRNRALRSYLQQVALRSAFKTDEEASSRGEDETANRINDYTVDLTWRQRARLFQSIRQETESSKEWPFELDTSCTSAFQGLLIDLDRIGLGSDVIALLARKVALFGSSTDENWLDSLLKR